MSSPAALAIGALAVLLLLVLLVSYTRGPGRRHRRDPEEAWLHHVRTRKDDRPYD